MFLKTGWPKQEVNELGKLLVSRQPGEEQDRCADREEEEDRVVVSDPYMTGDLITTNSITCTELSTY